MANHELFLKPKQVHLVPKHVFPVSMEVYFEKTLYACNKQKLTRLKLTVEAYLECHSLKSRATDQAAVID